MKHICFSSLSQVLRASLSADPVAPILLEPHLDALDRRLAKLLHVVHGCLEEVINYWAKIQLVYLFTNLFAYGSVNGLLSKHAQKRITIA